MKKTTIIIIFLIIVIITLAFQLIKILNTEYEFCYQGTCYYQKIGDYLQNKE
jgi:uncharacterized protein YxeA